MRILKKVFVFTVFSLSILQSAYAQESSMGTTSVFTKQQKFDHEGVELYSNNIEMKSYKKMGVGFASGGVSGFMGLNAEYNIRPTDALFAGLGTGKGYNTLSAGWKKNFEGYYMSPYTKVGVSRWTDSANTGSNPASESNILKTFLTNKEVVENSFALHLISGAVGLEYNQLEGDLSGVNLYGEIVAMTEVARGQIVPTGSIGITYFF